MDELFPADDADSEIHLAAVPAARRMADFIIAFAIDW
jgi:hypothetical protein